MSDVVFDNKCTKGRANMAIINIMGAVHLATVSGNNCPMRLGTNSPKSMVFKVMTVTTKVVAKIPATGAKTGQVENHADKVALKAASPMMPLSTPKVVMPI
jgi:hypothetical protein